MTKYTGIILYPGFEELDAVGPYEVFGMLSPATQGEWKVVTIAEKTGAVQAFNGLRVLADHGFDDAPPLDVIVVPGGLGSRTEMHNERLLDYLRDAGSKAEWVTSVCTGAMILHAAGYLDGKRATTHWGAIEELRALGNVEAVSGERYVRDGNVITSAGVSAGIDSALYLVSLLKDGATASRVQQMMEYYPKPPEFEEASV